ncbi:hypothetical protein GCM10027073_39620 [Streptomyces chlorus]|uniref:SpoIIE family protein phosphatase n=1 Tax=Streptomyces chlorus TaxID=887452 RepID=A0ABW1DWM9_9ACTN
MRVATADGRSGVTRYRLDTGSLFAMLTDGVVEGPSMQLDEGLDHVVRLAGISAVARLDADASAAAVIKGAAQVGHDDEAAVLVIAHDGPDAQP